MAQRMGFGEAFSYASAAEIFAEHAALSAFENEGTRDFDIGAYAGLDIAQFEKLAPFQWPSPSGQAKQRSRFFADGQFFTADRRARFVATLPKPEIRTSDAYPLVLNTGRVRDPLAYDDADRQKPRGYRNISRNPSRKSTLETRAV